jgi:transposase
VFTDEHWERILPLLPSNEGRRGHPFGDSRRVVEGIAYRYQRGIPWRDLPRELFGPWQTVWKRHRRYAGDGTWDRVLARILAEADAAGRIDWAVSVDATLFTSPVSVNMPSRTSAVWRSVRRRHRPGLNEANDCRPGVWRLTLTR